MHLKISITTEKQYSPRKRQVFEKFFYEKVDTCRNISLKLIISGEKIYPYFMYSNATTNIQIYQLNIDNLFLPSI